MAEFTVSNEAHDRLRASGWTSSAQESLQAVADFVKTLPDEINIDIPGVGPRDFSQKDIEQVQIAFALWSGRLCSDEELNGTKTPRWRFPFKVTHEQLVAFLEELCDNWVSKDTIPSAKSVKAPAYSVFRYGKIGPNSHLGSMSVNEFRAYLHMKPEDQAKVHEKDFSAARAPGSDVYLAIFHHKMHAIHPQISVPQVHFVDKKMKIVAYADIDFNEATTKLGWGRAVAKLFHHADQACREYAEDSLKTACLFAARRDLWRIYAKSATDSLLESCNAGPQSKDIYWGPAEALVDFIIQPPGYCRGNRALQDVVEPEYDALQLGLSPSMRG